MTRRLTPEELREIMPPRPDMHQEPEQDGRGTIAVGAGAFILLIGFAAYGAVKFGAGVVAYYLGVPL